MSKDGVDVQWLRGDTILEAGDRYDIFSDGKKRVLAIKESVLDDEGRYTVMLGDVKAKAQLKVIGKVFFSLYMSMHAVIVWFSMQLTNDTLIPFTEKLRIVIPLKDQTVKEGEELVFNCEVNTEGAKAKWYKNNEPIFDSAKYIMVHKDLLYSLRIRDAHLNDQAVYTVTLTNQRGEHVKSSANLTVLGKCSMLVNDPGYQSYPTLNKNIK